MKKIATLLIGSLFSLNAFASVITLETRDLDLGSFNNADYAQSWLNHTTSISTTNLAQFTNIQTGDDSFNLLTVDFDFGARDAVTAQFGLDSGLGVAVYLDGNFLQKDTSDNWWASNFNNAETVDVDGLGGNSHKLEVYWAEQCCNGSQSGRMSLDGGSSWQDLSVANLDAAYVKPSAIPEPSIIALFGLGLVGLGFARRRRQS